MRTERTSSVGKGYRLGVTATGAIKVTVVP
jgi:hypothetical protein